MSTEANVSAPLRLELRDPAELDGAEDAGPVAGTVVVDLFRATSTLRVLVEGGHEVVLVATPDAASEALRRGRPCAGEWHGVTPAGFVAGNSPTALRHLPVGDTPLTFLSSNGAGAIIRAARAGGVVITADTGNLDAVAATIAATGGFWRCVPAGQRGERRTEDDFICVEVARRLPGAAGPALTRLGRSLDGITRHDLATGPSARWLLEHEETGAEDLAFILSRPPHSPVVPYFDGASVRRLPARR